MLKMASEDYLCSPSKSWLERYEELADRSYPTVVVEDVIEPFGQPYTSTPYKPHGGDSRDQKGVRFDTSAIQNNGNDTEEKRRSRSPHRSMEDVEVNSINETGRKSPYRSGRESIEDIVYRYTPSRDLSLAEGRNTAINNSQETVQPPPIGSQMTYSPYRGPIQDEIHTQPYYGPIVSTVRTNFNEPDPAVLKGSGKASAIINKVHNKVSEERIEELSAQYRERMSRKFNNHAKQHHRSKSDNAVCDLDERSRSKGRSIDDRMFRKYENAVLQIERLEGQIKCLKMEVNSLTATKKQAEMRVSKKLCFVLVF
jgi:hypothetical protein